VVRESSAERDTEALLLHDILLNGILTIGTLGHEQSFLPAEELLVQEKQENLQTNIDQEEMIQQEPETPALVATAESKPVSRAGSLKMKSASMNARECTEIMEVCADKVVEMEEYRVSTQEKPLLMHEEKREEKTRTTLAELFAAEVFVEKLDLKEVKSEEDFVKKKVSEVKLCQDKMEKIKEKKSASKSAHTLNRVSHLYVIRLNNFIMVVLLDI
jgi:hypothetical protein